MILLPVNEHKASRMSIIYNTLSLQDHARHHILNATLTDGTAWGTQQHLNEEHERDVHGLLLRLQLQVRCGHHMSQVMRNMPHVTCHMDVTAVPRPRFWELRVADSPTN